MGKYAREPDNASKSCKARGSNLRVHFKVCISLVVVEGPSRFGHMERILHIGLR